jgi:hypothetical protein
MQQGRRNDIELSEILEVRAMDEREHAEALQRQAAQKLMREGRMREWAAGLRGRSQVTERLQKELDDLNL